MQYLVHTSNQCNNLFAWTTNKMQSNFTGSSIPAFLNNSSLISVFKLSISQQYLFESTVLLSGKKSYYRTSLNTTVYTALFSFEQNFTLIRFVIVHFAYSSFSCVVCCCKETTFHQQSQFLSKTEYFRLTNDQITPVDCFLLNLSKRLT